MVFYKIMKLLLIAITILSLMSFRQVTRGEKDSDEFQSILQPEEERQAQDTLPKSNDILWSVLAKTKLKKTDNPDIVKPHFPNEVLSLDGKSVIISGFMLPMESTEKFTHFMLSKRTPTCFFCAPGTQAEIIEVFASKPTIWESDLIKVKGTIKLLHKEEGSADSSFFFFQIKDAKIIK